MGALGTTTLSVVVWSLAVPATVFLGTAIYQGSTQWKQGASVMHIAKDSIFSAPTLISAGITVLAWLSLFLWTFLKTFRQDQQSLVAAQAELRRARSDTVWQIQLREHLEQKLEAVTRGGFTGEALAARAAELDRQILELNQIIKEYESRAEENRNRANSLFERTMALRRDLRTLIKEHPKPEIGRNPGEDGNDYVQRKWAETAPWVDKIMNGFELRFKERLRLLLHEYGELSIYDNLLGRTAEQAVNTDELLRQVMVHLGLIALKAEEREGEQ